ncbi:MAG: hypothetical protein ABR616_15670 [Dermatophilaceae bacterium]
MFLIEKGDISNSIAPKLVFIFDGLVGRIPQDEERVAARLRKRGKWDQLARVYEVDTKMGAHLWDIIWRSPFSFDIVSFETDDEKWYDALERLLNRANVPHSRLEIYADPNDFAQHMAYAPNILRVFHGNPSWNFKFGDRGQYVSDATVFELR